MDVRVCELEENNKIESICKVTPEARTASLIKERMTASPGETHFMNSVKPPI